ncbi:MAG: NAD(P)H-binding protein [Ignavibacteria bacterium]|nr:NAD(P)H-binding protein [Ignavibacteria bacterium]
MKTLVVGASGATGKLFVEQLLSSGQQVKIIVRSTGNIPDNWNNDDRLAIIKRNITEIGVDEMCKYVRDCTAVASCLGHNLTWKGIFGKPRKLVTDTVRVLCEAVQKNSPEKRIKFVLMNTTGNSNRDIHEPVSSAQKIVIGLLRVLLPPHSDNENAADYLRIIIGHKNSWIEWTVVRPDNLINEEKVTEYSLHKSPTRSAIFDPGKTSRINVAHFMTQLILNDNLWNKWKGQMPVIYNDTDETK